MAEIIDRPGVYEIPQARYHADDLCAVPTLSSSLAKLLVNRTPRHCFTAHPRLNPNFAPDEDPKFDLGSAAHALLLKDESQFMICQADDWRTKEARAMREDARADRRIPILAHQFDRVSYMVNQARAQLLIHEDAAGAFTNGKPEQTIVWKEGEIWCRARLDWCPDSGDIFDDYKSTAASADPDAWQRILFSIGFDIQAAFYSRGIKAVGLSKRPQFRFVVQETEAPHALCVIGLAPMALDLAEAKVEKALRLWEQCLRENKWPGYPNRTCYVAAPSWLETQFLDREARDYDRSDGPGLPDRLRAALNWDAPLERV